MTDYENASAEYRRRICRAMDFISQNLSRNPKLEEVAAAAAFSPYHFHRLFQAVVGETIAEFTRRLRLEKAAHRLNHDRTAEITVIAHQLGFSSSQNFAKAFKKHFSVSPSEYRKQSKIGNTDSNLGNVDPHNPEYFASLIAIEEQQRKNDMNVEVKDLPAYHVAYVRRVGAYGSEIKSAFDSLGAWAGPRGFFENGIILASYWDNPEITPTEKCRSDACVTVPENTQAEGPVGIQTLPAGRFAVSRVEIPDGEFESFWQALLRDWLPNSGYQLDDRSCYEIYYNQAHQHPENKWIVDLCQPVKLL